MTSMHSHHAPLFASSQHLAQQSTQQNAQHVQQASTSSYADYAVPSSLSESAFITITPPPSSPPALLAAHPPTATAERLSADAELDTPAPSTAKLLEHHMTRVRSNSEGRFGPAFSRSPSPVEGDAPTGESAGVDEEMRAAAPGGEGEPLSVSEGRTH